ncbi:MAG: MFS transporter [Candidatus Nomurabacteria bacterium]
MKEKDALRNVRLYKLYKSFGEPLMWGPILISCLMNLGHMELSEIYFMESVVLLGTIFLQIPMGALADIYGRKKIVLIGSVFLSISIFLFSKIDSPLSSWTANIVWMIGFSMCSGADSAFLYDSLKSLGKENEYKKIEGSAVGNRLLITAICSIFVGYLAEYYIRLPIILSIPGVVFSTIVVFFFKEPSIDKKYTTRQQIGIMKVSILFVSNHKEVKWIIFFVTLIGVTSKIWFFTYNPYFELVGLDLKYYGFVFFALNIVAWFFSKNVSYFSKKVDEYSIVILLVLLIVIPILVMSSIPSIFCVGMVFFQNVARGFMGPFFGEFINRHLNSENRATVLSIQSAVSGFAQFIALSAFGVLLKTYSLLFCLQILGIIVLVLGGLAILRFKRIFK